MESYPMDDTWPALGTGAYAYDDKQFKYIIGREIRGRRAKLVDWRLILNGENVTIQIRYKTKTCPALQYLNIAI